MSKELFEKMRLRVLAAQKDWAGRFWDSCISRALPEYEALMELPEELRKSELSAGHVLRHKLANFRFRYSAEEPMIGILELKEYDDEFRRRAGEYFADAPWLVSAGQAGHCTPDYELALTLGLDGIADRIREKQRLRDVPAYRNFLMALEGLSEMISHAAEAAAAAGNPAVASACRRIAHQPPETFLEAIQLLWFIEIGIQAGDRAYLINPGRLDRTLLPFYRDISHDDALELVAWLYLMLNHMCPNGMAYGVMVGGGTPCNELSRICLEALRLTRLVYPSVGICVNRDTPDDIMRLAVEIIASGNPCPAFFNDELIRRGLEYYGVPRAESDDYINSTCVEITPTACSNVYVASPYHNLCRVLLETMEEDCPDYETLKKRFRERLSAAIAAGVEEQRRCRADRAARMRRPLQSVFTRDCIERGLDIEEGGARCNWIECSFVGLANLADSLYVIRREVFEEGALSLREMLELCRNDFKDQEALRLKFLNSLPKYGQDVPEVDAIVKEMTEFFVSECARYRVEPGDAHYIPGTFCWIMHQLLGAETCATPDGRRAGFPFADGAGPAQGREKFGPTAAVASVCSWEHGKFIGGSAFNMKYSRRMLADPETREKLTALIRTFIAGGGFQTQINVVDGEMLAAADRDPDAWPDLVVRIGGYTDYFARLSPGMRREVMMRMQYDGI